MVEIKNDSDIFSETKEKVNPDELVLVVRRFMQGSMQHLDRKCAIVSESALKVELIVTRNPIWLVYLGRIIVFISERTRNTALKS